MSLLKEYNIIWENHINSQQDENYFHITLYGDSMTTYGRHSFGDIEEEMAEDPVKYIGNNPGFYYDPDKLFKLINEYNMDIIGLVLLESYGMASYHSKSVKFVACLRIESSENDNLFLQELEKAEMESGHDFDGESIRVDEYEIDRNQNKIVTDFTSVKNAVSKWEKFVESEQKKGLMDNKNKEKESSKKFWDREIEKVVGANKTYDGD